MKRRIIVSIVVFVFLTQLIDVSNAAVKAGGSCSKVNAVTSIRKVDFVCVKSGGRLQWLEAAKIAKIDPDFAREYLNVAKIQAKLLLDEAEVRAASISTKPKCDLYTKPMSGMSSERNNEGINFSTLYFENYTSCQISFNAIVPFLCPTGKSGDRGTSILSAGIITLKPKERKILQTNFASSFQLALQECALRTGYKSNLINLDRDKPAIKIQMISSFLPTVFNQQESNKVASKIIAKAKERYSLIIENALDPVIILQAQAAAEKAAAEKAAAEKAAAEKAAAEKAAIENQPAEKTRQDIGLGKTCVPNQNCPIGSTGPGGGIVFFDAGSVQSWGRYLEFVTSSDWSKYGLSLGFGPIEDWCSTTTDAVQKNLGTSNEIGAGKRNTLLMKQSCSSGIAVFANAYRGGNKTDWFIPSSAELNELCKFSKGQATGNTTQKCMNTGRFIRSELGEILSQLETRVFFWSSSESTSNEVAVQSFIDGGETVARKKYAGLSGVIFFRLVRAF